MADDSDAPTRFDPEALFAAALTEAQSLVAERFGAAIRAAEARGYERASEDSDALEALREAVDDVREAFRDVEREIEEADDGSVPDEDSTFDDVRNWLAHHGGDDVVNARKLAEKMGELREQVDALTRTLDRLSGQSHVREVG